MRIRGWNGNMGTKHGGPALLLLLVGLLVWLWPIGIGGKMPVGGDVTQFFMGLMGVPGRVAAREAGCRSGTTSGAMDFPGLAESQMGVVLSASPVLYRLASPPSTAYVVEPDRTYALGWSGGFLGGSAAGDLAAARPGRLRLVRRAGSS